MTTINARDFVRIAIAAEDGSEIGTWHGDMDRVRTERAVREARQAVDRWVLGHDDHTPIADAHGNVIYAESWYKIEFELHNQSDWRRVHVPHFSIAGRLMTALDDACDRRDGEAGSRQSATSRRSPVVI